MQSLPIPFNKPAYGETELELVTKSLNGVVSGNGPFCKQAEKVLSDMHGGSHALLTPSCSSALELAARLVGFGPGDEIIVPSFTFVTTVSSFVTNGASPVFCDIDPKTLGLDLGQAETLVSDRTRAICLVHYAGVPANPAAFAELAERYNLVLIEDNAHGFGGTAGDKALGTFGDLSTLSFHETKNISCGEGGALIVNRSELLERAEILREKGTNRSKFLSGIVDKYTWVDNGSSWVLSDILASVLVAQLGRFQELQAKRAAIWERYHHELSSWAEVQEVSLQPRDRFHTHHMFYVIFDDVRARDSFIAHMKSKGVMAVFHYQPLHRAPAGARWLTRDADFPVTDRISNGLVRLPLYAGLSFEEQTRVIESVKDFSVVPSGPRSAR